MAAAGSAGGAQAAEAVFVAVEPRLSMTASNADEWVSVVPGTEYLVALAMANVLGQFFRADVQIEVGWHPIAQSILLREPAIIPPERS